jgi:hypothetical protein
LSLKWITLLSLCGALTGCRAGVDQPDMGMPDMDGVEGGTPADMTPDLYGADLLCTTVEPENCTNACDDDKNGYTDDDDPVCTHQVVVTPHGTQTRIGRLILDGTPRLVELDGNVLSGNGAATVVKSFSPAIFFAAEGGKRVYRIQIPDGGAGAMTSYLALSWAPGAPRDVCVFNGELIVVDRIPSMTSSKLHRFTPDGMTDKGTVTLPAGVATACASDGDKLYVAIYDPVGGNSQFFAFDKTLTQTGTPIDMPAALIADGYDRVIDFAWSHKDGTFWGLFVKAMGNTNDTLLSATQVHPFGLDGGVGTPVTVPMDAGLHGIGTFIP